MKKIKQLYENSKLAKVGSTCKCPSCGTDFIKTNYQQAFCKSKKGTVCKDKYWNTITPEKRNNTTRISPANAFCMAMQDNQRSFGVKKTSEGYFVRDGIAYYEFGDKIYKVDIYEDEDDCGWDSHKH